MKLFFILGNQLFPLKYLDRFKKDHVFFMAEDNGLCTYEKHHKQKILLFLSSMRSYADNLKKNKLIEKVIPEPLGGIHRDPEKASKFLKKALIKELKNLADLPIEKLLEDRHEKLLSFGRFSE